MQNGRAELGKIHFHIDGKVYHIGNITFHDLDRNLVGGMLIFLPVHPTIPYIIVGVVGAIFFLWLIAHVLRRHRRNRIYLIGVPAISFLLFLFSIISYRYFVHSYEYYITIPPYTIYNSTITFNPESDLFNKNREQRVAIQITTGGESINAAQASVLYDPMLIRVEDIQMTNSFCDPNFVIEKEIDNKKGKVVIGCGKPNGFSGDTAILAELLIQPLRTGSLNMQFGDDTQVLANDGLGTNVLRTITDGSYQISDDNTKELNGKIQLFSYTHPNLARWYNTKNIHIDWPPHDDYDDYLYDFNQIPNTVPDGSQHTNTTSIDEVASTDGVYYFHLIPRAKNHIGQVSHLKIMVDTTPPEKPIIEADATEVRTGDIVRFKFVSPRDNLSGLQKNIYVRFGDGSVLFPTLPQLDVPFLEAGTYTINLRVFDNAGNFNDSDITKIIAY